MQDHSRYCQVVRYSPDGGLWASAGFDGNVFLYDGKDSEYVAKLEDGKAAHAGGIYGLSWSRDGKQMITASGDKSVKIWDMETRARTSQVVLGSDVLDQQLGCVWAQNHIISVSLSGKINYIDPRAGENPVKIIDGHNKPITAFTPGEDDKTAYTGSSDGRVVQWNTEDGLGKEITGKGAANQINGLLWTKDGLNVVGIDDTLRKAAGQGDCKAYNDTQLKLKGQPKDVKALNGRVLIATQNALLVLKNDQIVSETTLNYETSCLGVSEKNDTVIVGEGGSGQTLHVFKLSGDTPEEIKEIKLSGTPTSVEFSPAEDHVVSTDSNRKVTLFSVPNYEKPHNKEWGFHTAKVTCAAWSPDSKFVATGGLDCSVIIWSVEAPAKHHILLSAHTQSQITKISWIDGASVLTTGQDGNIKIWNVTWKP